MRFVTAAFPTGIVLVAAELDAGPVGLLANSFTSVSLDPPLVSINMARTSSTWPMLQRAPVWGISILAAHHEPTFRQLSKPAAERFAGVDWFAGEGGAVLLQGASASFVVSPHAQVDAGDHVLLLLRVQELQRDPNQLPLVFYGSQPQQLSTSPAETSLPQAMRDNP